ncbi:GntR family transcriptional regulator [Mycobacterium sp. 1274756.6]|uniref:GntR family transcriptional regulator n=1 Tax=Mycobacterium sp. 1274756.6 TaxID=1834076 RepID=UPI0007FF8135|nr:GntR family transcriptional regulator [Mycobacterium sp. 1274756.6]OBJ71887.1 GntR family transcriptional regulator [Mycobacterium sp. 1274756.6]
MTSAEFPPRSQLSEQVAHYVRSRIFDGSYPAGSFVRLDQLAADLGISVTPVREALVGLRAEGLLDQQPHRGFVVLPLTDRDISDVSAVQAHIGGELAARAADGIDEDRLDELHRVQAQLEQAYRRGDDPAAVRLNHEFHRLINVAAGSPKLAQLMSQITRYAPESVFPLVAGWPTTSKHHHRQILAALGRRDREGARTAMAEHLAAGAEPMIAHLRAHGVLHPGAGG